MSHVIAWKIRSLAVLLLVLTLTVPIVSCRAKVPAATLQAETEEPPGAPSRIVYEGYGIGVWIQQNKDGPAFRTYSVPSGRPFESIYHVLHQIPKGDDYLIFCLLDYKQVPFILDGQENIIHRVHLKAMEERFFSFRIPALTEGLHDLALVLIIKPDEHSLSEKFRFSTDFALFHDARIVLLVGKSRLPPSIDYDIQGQHIPIEKRKVQFHGLLVNQHDGPQDLFAWLSEDVNPNQVLTYIVHIGNDTDDPKVFALMAFLDFKQVPLSMKDEHWVKYGKLDTGERATVPGSLLVPSESGVHEFMIVWALSPYQPLERPMEGNAREITHIDTRIEPSIRIALVTKQVD